MVSKIGYSKGSNPSVAEQPLALLLFSPNRSDAPVHYHWGCADSNAAAALLSNGLENK